ncbi:hypothetical protein [Phytohabitans flavus]|uniref:hypothetical protein n=1 Tax=Phytohabitans flavus TaxID=1076124 RepID=UPI0031E78256
MVLLSDRTTPSAHLTVTAESVVPNPVIGSMAASAGWVGPSGSTIASAVAATRAATPAATLPRMLLRLVMPALRAS